MLSLRDWAKLWNEYLQDSRTVYKDGRTKTDFNNLARQKAKRPDMVNHKVPTHLSRDKKKKIFKTRSKCK